MNEEICPNCNSGNIINIGDYSHNIFLCRVCYNHWYVKELHKCLQSDEDYIYRRKSNIVIVMCKKCKKTYIYDLNDFTKRDLDKD